MASFQPVRLAYNTHEPVGGADHNLNPIIYLHGLTAFKETWEEIPQVVANATKRMSFSVDARNHGDSEWSDPFSFDLNVDDLIYFMDYQGIRKAIIVGHSMGGITAIKTALRKPDRVEKIVVEDISVRKILESSVATITTYISLLRKATEATPEDLDEDEAKKFILKHIYDSLPPEMKNMVTPGQTGDLESQLRSLGVRRGADGHYTSKCNLDVIQRALQNMDTLDSDPEGQFGGPACFIYGKISPLLVGSDEHRIKQFFPNAVLEGVEEVGHKVHGLKPLEFTDILLKFLS